MMKLEQINEIAESTVLQGRFVKLQIPLNNPPAPEELSAAFSRAATWPRILARTNARSSCRRSDTSGSTPGCRRDPSHLFEPDGHAFVVLLRLLEGVFQLFPGDRAAAGLGFRDGFARLCFAGPAILSIGSSDASAQGGRAATVGKRRNAARRVRGEHDACSSVWKDCKSRAVPAAALAERSDSPPGRSERTGPKQMSVISSNWPVPLKTPQGPG